MTSLTKKSILILMIGVWPFISEAQPQNIKVDGGTYLPNHLPFKIINGLSNDTIINFYRDNNMSLYNNYVPIDSCFFKVQKITQKLNELLVFNRDRSKLIFYKGSVCANNTLIINQSDFSTIPHSNEHRLFDSLMSYLLPISKIDTFKKEFTAIIIWNWCMGIKADDNLFMWEKAIKDRYGHEKVQIIKINWDMNINYSEQYKIKCLSLFNKFYQLYQMSQ